MNHLMRFLCLCLTVGMLLPTFVSCSDEPAPAEDTSVSTESTDTAAPAVETTTSEPGRADAKDTLPEDLSLNGMNIHIHSFANEQYDIIGMNETSGDVLYDAVYERTCSVAERLDVNITWADSQTAKWQDFSDELNQVILAGDDVWQIVFAMGNATIQKNRDALFTDLAGAKYLDFSQPWWWAQAMEEVAFNIEERKYLVGDIALSNYMSAGAYFFNKTLYTDIFGNADDLYQTVIDGNWTYDKLKEISAGAYQDLNGNGAVDEGDLYGLRFGNPEFLKHAEFSMDVQHFYRDENGYPVIEYDVQRSQQAVEALYSLLYETKGNIYQSDNLDRSIFPQRGTFFYARHLGEVFKAEMRDMEDDYGILPFPKLDEQQEEYHGLLHNSSNFVTVPVTAQHVDEICAVIEAMCAESYRSVVETFYDIALKTKYSRDSFSGRCIDIIRDATKKNLVYEYNGRFGSGNIIADCIGAGNTNFSSAYAKAVTTSNAIIQKTVNQLLKEKSQ